MAASLNELSQIHERNIYVINYKLVNKNKKIEALPPALCIDKPQCVGQMTYF